MEIVLIRHGEPEWVRDGLNVVDPPLTERGLAAGRAGRGCAGRRSVRRDHHLAVAATAADGRACALRRRGADGDRDRSSRRSASRTGTARRPNWRRRPTRRSGPVPPSERWEGVGRRRAVARLRRARARRRDRRSWQLAGMYRIEADAAGVAHRRPRTAHRRRRPRRHERRAAVPPAGPRPGAVGVGPLRHRARLDHPAACRSSSATATRSASPSCPTSSTSPSTTAPASAAMSDMRAAAHLHLTRCSASA